MKKIYKYSVIQHWLSLIGMICLALPIKAQLSTPPIIQGQQVIEGGVDADSRARLAKASTGDFGVLNGTGLTYLNSAGLLKSTAAVEGSIQIGTSPVEYTKVVRTLGLAPANDGGFIVLANDATNLYIIKKDASQNRVWSTILAPLSNQAGTEAYGGIALVATTDGNYMAFAGHGLSGLLTNITAFKFTGSGTLLWSRDIFSPQTSPIGGCPNIQGYDKITASPDGNFLLTGGQFCQSTRPNPNQAIAAKINSEAQLVWTRTYSSFVAFSDQIANPYEAGTFLVLTTTDPTFSGSFNGPTYPGKLQADGTVVGLGNYAAVGRSTLASDGSGQPYFVVQEPISQNGGDFKLTGLNQTYAPVWTKTVGGSSADVPQAILATGDGYLVAGTTTSTDGDVKGKQGNALATWAVKLSKSATPLVMAAPTYNCQTGFITFNVTGGDGSPISYTAPGVSRASATDNFGTVEAGLRSDPKFIAITATQSGASVTYNFDLKAACSSGPPALKPPVLNQPIPDQTYTVGQSVNFPLGSYFSDPNLGGPGNLASDWVFSITGLPNGLYVATQDLRYTPAVTILGAPTAVGPGVYNVMITATIAALRGSPLVTTFKITVLPNNPPTGAFALVAPDYNCSTGAITFKTTGGNGTTIEYQSPGITGWTTNPNQFVDKDSRTANDVKPFTLMARQSGNVVTYVWDLKAACSSSPTPKPPVVRPIPDQTYTVGQSVYFVLGGYFSDPTTGVPNYRPNWSFSVNGLPPGVSLFLETVELMFSPAAILVGTATTAGVYTVNVTANTVGGSVSTSFKITVSATTPPPTGALALVAPDYNCTTGALTFKTTGGNGTTIEYQSPGITGWTTNPNQFVDKDSRTANDVKPFTLMARQSGNVVTYVWDLKAACGRARVGLEESGAGLQVRVLGNPVVGPTADIEISGVLGQSIRLNLVDGKGRALYQHNIDQAGVLEQVRVPLGQRSGLLLLKVQTASEHKTVKLLKD